MIDELHKEVSFIKDVIHHVPTKNVNTDDDKQIIKDVSVLYFKKCRPFVVSLGFEDEFIQKYDALWHSLLRLAHSNNAKRSYQKVIKTLWNMTTKISIRAKMSPDLYQEMRFSEDERILFDTLNKMIPSNANSYKQAIIDLNGGTDRLSYKGIAAELREVLRETLDHLAPDEEVIKDPHYKNEPGLTKPTMKQKVRHILKLRKRTASQRSTTEKSVELVEQLSADVARAMYDRASLATHVESSKSEVQKIKRYLDTILFDLLEIR
jgi:hypothetical protein